MIPLLAASGALSIARTFASAASGRSDEAKAAKLTEGTPEADFLKIARQSPAERLREKILKKLDLTEEDLAKMDPEKRAEVNEMIRQEVKRELEQGGKEQDKAAGVGVLTDKRV